MDNIETQNKILQLEQQIIELENKWKSLTNFSTIPLEIEKSLTSDGVIITELETESPIIMSGTCTITIASPAVITSTSPNPHNLFIGQRIQFTTSGALPTGITTATDYYIIADGFNTSNFRISTTSGGSAVNTSGTQSGSHSYNDPYIVWELNATKWAIIKDRGTNLRYYLPFYTIGQF